jgi:acyl carrier protein phosphodiesterase
MNYLAHLFLSANDPGQLIGNLAADFLNGPCPYTHPALLAGIARHRLVDRFTDAHPAFRASRRRIAPPHHRYAGVLVDLFYDHLLAVHWEHYAGLPLDDFSAWVYGQLEAHHSLLPPRLQRAAPRMIAEHWLGQYARPAGVARALHGLSRRSRRATDLTPAVADLTAHYDHFADDFEVFFPALLAELAPLGPTCGQLPAHALTRATLA